MAREIRWRSFTDLPTAFGGAQAGGLLRLHPEDFRVDEIPCWKPDGNGEHLLVQIRKTSANTEWVARRLASYARLPVSAVGYAGLKDRHAVTTQWFSLHLGSGREPDMASFREEGVEVLRCVRHRRKLRRGALSANRFRIRVRALEAQGDGLEQRIGAVRSRGVPNYFGAQRFGRGDGNLQAADALFAGRAKRAGRHLRGLWISAARSQLFNEVLARRVERGDWDKALDGDRLQLNGSRSHFLASAVDDDIRERIAGHDLHPTGPLWGAGDELCAGEPAALEREVIERFGSWAEGLRSAGLRHERRSLRLSVRDLIARRESADLVLAFSLPPGAFATAVLREIVDRGETPR